MKITKCIDCIISNNTVLIASVVFLMMGCGSDSSDSNNDGYVKLYNAASNSPAIYLTVDEDLETSEDDDIEITYSGVEYGEALNSSILEPDEYTFELAWQDGDSTNRNDLTLVHQSNIEIIADAIQLIVISEDVLSPAVMIYDIPVIDDEDDDVYDLFNVRVLNMQSDAEGIDVYLSNSDETFNEASLVGQYSYQEMSDNQKFDQDDYIFYVTKQGSQDVLFQSNDIDFPYSGQYIMVIRENDGAGSSPYLLDKVSNTSFESFIDFNSEAQFNAYNALKTHDLLPDYQGEFVVHVDGVDESPEIESLAFGQLSNAIELAKGDYSLDLLTTDQASPLLSNHLMSLTENSSKTVFFYLDEVAVDEDNDGNVDEDGDGIIDELDVNIHSLVIDNSSRASIYDHEIKVVNLVDTEDFSLINIYFVRYDETIDTALYKRSVGFAKSEALYLKNNTYKVYVIAKENSSDIILNAFDFTLDETSKEQFIVVEADVNEPTGFKVSVFDQTH